MHDMDLCTRHCCLRKSCDLAFMIRDTCYLVKCANGLLCKTKKARPSNMNPRICFVSHLSGVTLKPGECKFFILYPYLPHIIIWLQNQSIVKEIRLTLKMPIFTISLLHRPRTRLILLTLNWIGSDYVFGSNLIIEHSAINTSIHQDTIKMVVMVKQLIIHYLKLNKDFCLIIKCVQSHPMYDMQIRCRSTTRSYRLQLKHLTLPLE